MARPKSPARTKQYVGNIGVEGRMTGLKLQERPRDEHGLEITDGLFDPTPGRSMRKTTRQSDGKFPSSETMLIAESSAPEPTDVLSTRKQARDGRSILPLPHTRSPIKTSLGATPRRGSSIGAMSPARPLSSRRNEGPHTASRRLDFSTTQGRQSPYYGAPKSPSGTLKSPSGAFKSPSRRPTSASRRTQKDVYDYPQSPSLIDEDLPNRVEDEDEDVPNGIEDEDLPPTLDDDVDNVEEEQPREEEVAATKAQAASANNNKRKRGRRSNADIAAEAQSANEETPGVDEEVPDPEAAEPPTKKRGGRPPKSQARAALATKDKNQAAKRGPKAKRDPIQRATSKEPGHFNALQRPRHQTPMDEDGFTHTRSGRTSYKPLVFWKGERAIFESGFETAQTLPSLQEIIRIDEVTPQKRSMNRSNASKKTKRRARASVFEDDDPEDFDGFEPWETSEGTQEAPVAQWDDEQNATTQEEEIETIAFSANRIQPRPTPENPSFHFTKCLTTKFFGSGMIELPPEGSKGRKNSRKFQFSFYVCSGKVAVEVAGSRFVISKGGMWQVPRGNLYSITNESRSHSARIFFAQACSYKADVQAPNSVDRLNE